MTESKSVPGFRSGFRQGLGFMAAVALVNAVACIIFVLVAWLTYGSVRNLAVAAVRDVVGAAGGVTRVVADEAKAGAARVRDHAVGRAASVVRQVGDGARDAGTAVRDKAAAAGERAGEAKEALKDRFGGLVGRFRSRATPDAPGTVETAPGGLQESPPTQGGPATKDAEAAP